MPSIKPSKNILILAGVVFIGLSTLRTCYAACPGVGIVPVPATIDINPTLAVGAMLGQTTLSWGDMAVAACRFPSGQQIYKFEGVGVPNGNIYPTSIPGIGYRGHVNGWPAGFEQYWPLTKTYSVANNPGPDSAISAGTLTFELVKTGPIQPGIFAAQTIMTSSIAGVPFLTLITAGSIVVAPVTPACTVTQSAIPVNLEDVNSSQLTTAGSTSKDQAFSIPLTCTAAANIALGFSGDVADATNAVFRNLSGSANASTVGVQILSGGTPVPTAAGTFLNLGSTNGSRSVPLVARYYALANNPDVGAVSAIAYATVVYN